MAAQLRYSPLPNPSANLAGTHRFPAGTPHFRSISFSSPYSYHSSTTTLSLLLPKSSNPNISRTLTSHDLPDGSNNNNNNSSNNNNGGGGWGSDGASSDHHHEEPSDPAGPLGVFLNGWRSRVLADPEFPFKVLMEELVGVTSCCLGDMASRPNFGLNELDLVFSTLVVGSIVNFVLMYLLAPTAAASSSSLPSIFASCPSSHMFQPGPFSLLDRIGTFVYKGVTFAAVGFAAGLAGTAISNGLIAMRKRMDPEFETPNKAPPTVLNALTWAIHMGVSSNFRYQTLNGVEFVMARAMPTAGFKLAVLLMRCLNNVLGGMSFVVLARMTGSQKVEKEEEEKERLIEDGGDGELGRSESHSK